MSEAAYIPDHTVAAPIPHLSAVPGAVPERTGLTQLPAELAELVTPEQIAENGARLLGSLPEVNPVDVEVAKARLLEAFLIHETNAGNGFQHGIVPNIQNPSVEPGGYTFDLDKSLGFDKVTFMNWPFVPEIKDFGVNKVLVSTDLLFDDRCFVTPNDLYDTAQPGEDEFGNPLEVSDEEIARQELVYEDFYDGESYDELLKTIDAPKPVRFDDMHIPAKEVKSIAEMIKLQLDHGYFRKMVSGEVWLEYLSRLLVLEGPESLPLGEIKFFGKVPAGNIRAIISSEEFDQTYIPHIEQILRGDEQ
jgi:hypothetical protein